MIRTPNLTVGVGCFTDLATPSLANLDPLSLRFSALFFDTAPLGAMYKFSQCVFQPSFNFKSQLDTLMGHLLCTSMGSRAV